MAKTIKQTILLTTTISNPADGANAYYTFTYYNKRSHARVSIRPRRPALPAIHTIEAKKK